MVTFQVCGCGSPIRQAGTGRPRFYCSAACRSAACRARRALRGGPEGTFRAEGGAVPGQPAPEPGGRADEPSTTPTHFEAATLTPLSPGEGFQSLLLHPAAPSVSARGVGQQAVAAVLEARGVALAFQRLGYEAPPVLADRCRRLADGLMALIESEFPGSL